MLVAPPRGPHPAMRIVWFWRGLGLGLLAVPCLGWPVVLPIGFALAAWGVDEVAAFGFAWILVCFAWLVGTIVWSRRALDAMTFDLGGDVLRIRKGLWFRTLATIPLQNVQGFVVRSGPLLRRYGLSTVRIRTASSRSGIPWDEAVLAGIVDAGAVVANLEERRQGIKVVPDASAPTWRPVSPPGPSGLR